MAAEGGVITFITALDNDQLEQDLSEAQKKVDEVKKKIEENDGKKSAIEQQMDQASLAVDATKKHVEELKQKLSELENTAPEDMNAWHSAQAQIREIKAEIDECNASIETQTAEIDKLDSQWQKLDGAAEQYAFELEGATSRATGLAEQVSSGYYQAGEKVRTTFDSMSTSVANFSDRIGSLIQRTFVFSVFTSFLRELKKGISEALQQNDAFSASWEYLSATMQGFANGIANVIAPALITVINAVTSCIMMLAQTIDTVFQTGLVSAIGAARKTAEQSWRQTDESKKAQKEADSIAKKQATQDKKYAQAQEKYAKQEQKAAERLADAQEKAAKRLAKAEAKYPEAVEKAEKRQTKAEEKMAERLAKAEESAAERQAKAEEKAAKRQAKAEERAAERTAKAQERYDKRVEKAAQRAQKAQEKANQSILGFDEITKMTEDSAEDYASALEEIEAPESYEIDPSDYVIDPDDYAINYDDYKIDPSDFFVDPEDYTFDPMDYWVDLDDYKLDPFSFDWEDFATVDPTASMRPSWNALDVGKVTEQVALLETALAGMLLAVGAILAFSGINIPLGLALMATGALLYAKVIAEDWEKLPAELQDKITGALVLTGMALLVIGAILAASMVNLPVGVGMMAAGAALLGYAAALNWDSLSPQLQGALTTVMSVVAGFLFAVGVLLCTLGEIPFGVGLIIAGFATVAAVAALNWDSLSGTMTEKLTVIGEIVAGALFGIGVLLCLVGNVPLGIAAMVAGAAVLGLTQAIVNWDTLGPLLEQHVNEILGIAMLGLFAIGVVLLIIGNYPLGIGCIVGATIAGVTLAAVNWDTLGPWLEQNINDLLGIAMAGLFVIGVLLCLNSMFPLGIGCIVAATIAGVSLAAINWDTVGPFLEEHVNEILAIAMAGLFAIGVILCLLNMFPLGIGCITASVIAGVTLAAINWESLKPFLEQHVSDILAVAMTGLFAIGVILCLLSMFPLGIGCIVAATIAGVTLAVINWETIKTTLENNLEDILGTTMTFLFVIGVILCMVGNFPLGIGCIVAATIEGVTLAVINWDFIKEKCAEVWKGVQEWWDNGPSKIFTVEWWEELFQCIPDAIVNAINSVTEVFNSWFQGVQDCLAEVVGASGGTYTYSSPVPSVRPPGLARGAVIPPNREFMAVLGDQTSGNNIETPEQLMRDVVRQEAGSIMAEMMLQMQAMQSSNGGDGDFVVPIIIDSEELARAVFKGQGRASRRGVIGAELSFA